MRYKVTMREMWFQDVIVEADSPEEARQLAADGDGTFVDEETWDRLDLPEGFVFSHSFDNDLWEVEKL